MGGPGERADGDGVLRAGAARVEITPPSGREMAGYVRRDGPAVGVADPLWCRVLVLDDATTTLVVVALDVLYATAALTARVRAQVGARLAPRSAHVMVAATHTHCGPGQLAGERDPQLLDAIAAAAGLAAERAAAAARPARLAAGAVEVPGIGINRRDGATPHDERVHVVAVLAQEGVGDAIATLLVHACHPTILEHDERRWSAELPGAACDAVERLCGGRAIFLQGCAADVNPIFTEHSVEESRRVGTIVGAAAAGLALRLRALGRASRTINLSEERERPVATDAPGRLVAPAALRGELASAVARRRLRPAAAAVRAELARLRAQAGRGGAPPVPHGRAAELWAEDLQLSGLDPLSDVDLPAEEAVSVPVQAFRLGAGLVLVALPGEPFAATGLALTARAGEGVLVAGYANVSVGYLPPDDEFERAGYEVGRSVYARGTAERLEAVALELAERLTRG